jgi:hypothetical protein
LWKKSQVEGRKSKVKGKKSEVGGQRSAGREQRVENMGNGGKKNLSGRRRGAQSRRLKTLAFAVLCGLLFVLNTKIAKRSKGQSKTEH